MPLNPEQALDESTHRKVEGAFDELQRAARNIEREACAIEDEGGEQRLADLLRSVSSDLRATLKQTMARAYYRPQTKDEARDGVPHHTDPPKASIGVPKDKEQVSLFDEAGDDSLAA